MADGGREARQRAGGNQLSRPVPLRRARPRGDVPRSRGREEIEPFRAVRSDCLRAAFVVLRSTVEGEGRQAPPRPRRPPARSTWWRNGSRRRAIRSSSPRPARTSSRAPSGSSTIWRPAPSCSTAAGKFFCNRAPTKSTPATSTTSRPARAVWAAWPPKGPAGSAASLSIGPTSSWKPSGRTSCGSSRKGKSRSSRLTGGAELKFPGVGQLQAQEIFFWLAETPPAARTSRPNCGPTACWPATTST